MKSDMKQDMVNDVMDMNAGEEEEEEADDVYNNILGEIGLEYIENDPVSSACFNTYIGKISEANIKTG